MNIEVIKTGFLRENCYVISCKDKCLIVDPGDDFNLLDEKLKGKNLLAILITHYHFDHVGALKDLLNKYEVSVYDYKNIGDKKIGPFRFSIIKTIGHTNDSVSFYFKDDKKMFVGDFIFKDSIGRCDLPTGDFDAMKKSLIDLKKIGENITLYPGHGDITTLNEEKENNYYMKGD